MLFGRMIGGGSVGNTSNNTNNSSNSQSNNAAGLKPVVRSNDDWLANLINQAQKKLDVFLDGAGGKQKNQVRGEVYDSFLKKLCLY